MTERSAPVIEKKKRKKNQPEQTIHLLPEWSRQAIKTFCVIYVCLNIVVGTQREKY